MIAFLSIELYCENTENKRCIIITPFKNQSHYYNNILQKPSQVEKSKKPHPSLEGIQSFAAH